MQQEVSKYVFDETVFSFDYKRPEALYANSQQPSQSKRSHQPLPRESTNPKHAIISQPSFENTKDLKMYFQSSIRNVGLFTSVAIAAIGIARAFRQKPGFRQVYAWVAYMLGACFLLMSIMIAKQLQLDMQSHLSLYNMQDQDLWVLIPQVGLAVDMSLLFVIGMSILSLIFKF